MQWFEWFESLKSLKNYTCLCSIVTKIDILIYYYFHKSIISIISISSISIISISSISSDMVQLLNLTPAILSIRFELLVTRLEEGKVIECVRMCCIYAKELEEKSVPILSREESHHISQELFEVELAILCHGFCPQYAMQKAKAVRDLIIKKLVNFVFIRNRLMDDALPRDVVGTLYDLPASFKYAVAQQLQDEYV